MDREMEIAVLRDAQEITRKFAKAKRDKEYHEAANILEVLIGELEIEQTAEQTR